MVVIPLCDGPKQERINKDHFGVCENINISNVDYFYMLLSKLQCIPLLSCNNDFTDLSGRSVFSEVLYAAQKSQ